MNNDNNENDLGVVAELISILREEVARLQIQNMDLRAALSYREKQEAAKATEKDS